jgi:hypothetical protein
MIYQNTNAQKKRAIIMNTDKTKRKNVSKEFTADDIIEAS